MDKVEGVWTMKRSTRTPGLILLLALVIVVFSVGCSKTVKSDRELATEAIEEYLTSVREHDIERTTALVLGDERIFDPNKESLLMAGYYPIDDCQLDSIEFPDTGDSWDYLVVVAHLTIVYSDEYLPIGDRVRGENKIRERYTLEKRDGKFVIIGVAPVYYW